MPLAELLDAVFARRFRYGIPIGVSATVRVHNGVIGCWKCRARTRIITFIEVLVGPYNCQFTVSDLSDFPDLLASCQVHTKAPRVGAINEITRLSHRFDPFWVFPQGVRRSPYFARRAWGVVPAFAGRR